MLAELTAATREQACDDGQVIDLVACDGGHDADPVLGRDRLGPALKQFERVRGGLALQVRVVVEEFDRLREGAEAPGIGGVAAEGEVGGGGMGMGRWWMVTEGAGAVTGTGTGTGAGTGTHTRTRTRTRTHTRTRTRTRTHTRTHTRTRTHTCTRTRPRARTRPRRKTKHHATERRPLTATAAWCLCLVRCASPQITSRFRPVSDGSTPLRNSHLSSAIQAPPPRSHRRARVPTR